VLRPREPAPVLELQPVFGRALSLPDDLASGPIGVVCLGGVSTPDTRAAVATLQDASAQLDRLGVRLVVLCTSGDDRVREFVSRYHVLFPMVADPSLELRRTFGLQAGGLMDGMRGLARELSRPGRSLRIGRGWLEEGAYTPAACFLLGADGAVAWSAEGIHATAMVEAARLSQPLE